MRAAAAREDRGADRTFDETMTVRDIGVWGHYIGDGSQPLHASIHFNGWGRYPNPHDYSQSNTLHSRFESAFVRNHVESKRVLDMVRATPAQSCAAIEPCTALFLKRTVADVPAVYDLEKQHAFDADSRAAVQLVDDRLAAGAVMLRDRITDAWTASRTATVGYPAVSVQQIEDAIVHEASRAALQTLALSEGYVPMREHAAFLIAEGVTSLAEVREAIALEINSHVA